MTSFVSVNRDDLHDVTFAIFIYPWRYPSRFLPLQVLQFSMGKTLKLINMIQNGSLLAEREIVLTDLPIFNIMGEENRGIGLFMSSFALRVLNRSLYYLGKNVVFRVVQKLATSSIIWKSCICFRNRRMKYLKRCYYANRIVWKLIIQWIQETTLNLEDYVCL